MIIQSKPEVFYTKDKIIQIIRDWSLTTSLPAFKRLIPFFFDQLTKQDSPTDIWLVRDILYNSGEKVIRKDQTLEILASKLSDELIKNIYYEINGVKTGYEFIKRIYSIGAEIKCAFLIKEAGAENIRKSITPEDITCTYNNIPLGFQIKFKGDEDFVLSLLEETLLGEMCKTNSSRLREFSNIIIKNEKNVHKGFLKDLITFVHNDLTNHLQFLKKEYSTKNLLIKTKSINNKIFLDINGIGKYIDSFLTITFKHNPGRFMGNFKIGYPDNEPEEELWKLLENKIKEIKPVPLLIGWIDLEMSFQYDKFFSSKTNQDKIIEFLNKFSIPLVLRSIVRYNNKIDLIIANHLAMNFSLIQKIISSKQLN